MFRQDKEEPAEVFTRVTCKGTAVTVATARAPPDPVAGRLHLNPAAIRVLMSLHRGMLSPSLLERSIAAASASSSPLPTSPSCYSTCSTSSTLSSSSAYFTPTSPSVPEFDTRMRMDSEAPIESLNGTSDIRSAEVLAAAGYKRAWSTDKERILLGPYDHLISHPGGNIRHHLLVAFNAWLQVPEASLQIISKVVAMLHTASLLVDDVEDDSTLRRGVPVAHSIFGVAQTINSANYVYFRALEELSKLNNPLALKIFTEELLNLHRGQGMDLFWRDTLTTPSEDDYLEMVSNKTGGLFRLAVKLMQAESASDKDYVPLVNLIGLIYQIRDDYMNLQSDQYKKNKGFCDDFTEGKFSFPIIHSIRSDTSNRQLLNILKQHTRDDDVKLYAVTYMEEQTGSFEYTKKVLAELHRKANEDLEQLGGNEPLTEILQKMMV